MHLELTPEAILTQLGYSVNDQTVAQIKRIIDNTPGLEKFLPHLPSFIDALKVEKGYVAMSNSKDYLKVKCDENISEESLQACLDILNHWADKYKLELQKVEGKHTYYILGHK
jgi:hypothetical protein